jgi:CubicO group peptidase (beta-lactamase class C family)
MKPRTSKIPFAIALLTTVCLSFAAPDEELLGKSKGYPIGHAANWFFDESVRVGSFTNQDKITNLYGKSNEVTAGGTIMPLPKVDKEPNFRWQVRGQSNLTVDDFLSRQRIMGLLIIKDGVIQVERYQYDRTPEQRFLSNSMAKSILSLGVGFAVDEKRIDLDKTAEVYASALKDTIYGETTVRNLLRMSSGAKFEEKYNGNDDLAKYNRASLAGGVAAGAKVIDTRLSPQGEKFNYGSAETEILALVLRSVISVSISEYLSQKLWKPMGAEQSALWRAYPDGLEKASGNFNATMRDYGRLGVVLANDGMRSDTKQQLISKQYLDDATRADKQPPQFRPQQATPYFGYGYQFWIFPGSKHRFALQGVYGQSIFVDPESKLVMVITAANKTAKSGETTLGIESNAFWRGLVENWSRW